jgi:hypothetical protein
VPKQATKTTSSRTGAAAVAPQGPQRWVMVDPTTKRIVGGPYLWDGHTEWEPPEQGQLMLEAEALEAGYTFPEPETA